MPTAISLTEEFNDTQGKIWRNYDAYQDTDRTNMAAVKHVDIRTFEQNDLTAAKTVLELSTLTMDQLSTQTMANLTLDTTLGSGEKWTNAECEKVVGNKYVNSINILADSTGAVSASSVIPKKYGDLESTNYVNLCPEPNFEEPLTGWVVVGAGNNHISNNSATFARSQDVIPHSGSRSGILSTLTASSGRGASLKIPGTFKQGVAYTASIWIRKSTGSANVLGLYFGQGATDRNNVPTGTVGTTWTRVSVTWTPSADRNDVFLAILTESGASGSTWYIDDICVTATDGANHPSYFDGNDPRYIWLGTPNLSTSAGPYDIEIETVDLLTDFEDDDHIVLSAPAYTAGTTAASSYLDLTSNPSGDFTAGPTASAAFSTSVTTPTNGSPSELRFLRSQFNTIDLSKVTGVRIRITSSNATPTNHTFAAGVRLLPKDWQYTGIDIDTRFGRLRKTLPRNGSTATAPSFTWPILWRSNVPSGTHDPKPIDTEFGAVFNTGTISSSNTISLYFREVTADFLTQLDLNGMKQSQLNGYDQPDTGTAKYNSRTMDDLSVFDQSALEDETQFSLERTPDYTSASWIQVFLQWGSGGAGTVTFVNSEGGGYSIPLTTTLSNNTRYVFRVRCEETTMRATIYSLDGSGAVVAKIFDSTTISDSFNFKRRAGRFGWAIDLQDGSAWVDSIRERYASFGEYRSLPLYSNTPVDGAELFVGSSPNVEKFTELLPGRFNTVNTTINQDSERSVSGSSWKIVSTASDPLQGVQTNNFLITDWVNSRAEFDIYHPSGAAPLQVFLFDKDYLRIVEVVVPNIINDQWQHIKIDFPYDTLLTGEYTLAILQLTSSAIPWWIDNMSVFSRSVAWEGRSVVDDPWKSNNAQWTPFNEVHNQEHGGVLFPRRGSELQIRGRALRQYAEIDRIQFKPKYAQLGRVPASVPTDPTAYDFGKGKPVNGAVTASWSATTPGGSPPLTRRFTASAVSTYGGPGAYIAQYRWNFGDGSVGHGDVVDHTFPASGAYSVTLTVIDNYGFQGTYVDSIGI